MIKKSIIVLLIVLELFVFHQVNKSLEFKDTKELPQAKLKETTLKKGMFALMLQDEEGNYQPSSNELPTENDGYVFNDEKSGCIDINGVLIDNALSYKDYTLTIETGKTAYCYLYYDIETKGITPLELKEKDTSVLAEAGGMFRYQGLATDEINNYICLGVSCNTESIDEEDMYRIIGITEDGQIKVIKKTAMKEDTKKSFSWHTKYTTDTKWPDSDLFHRLNDNGSGTYSTTSFYSKLDASVKEHIDDKHLWNYGDTSDTVQYNGDFYYGIETGTADASHRIKNANDNDYTTEKYKWNTSSSDPKKEAPIGLMYVHDYLYAYPDGKTDSYSNLKNAWIFLENNDDNIYNKDSGSSYWYEWTMTRFGYYSGGYYYARFVSYTGLVSDNTLTLSYAVRPVFYLESDIKLSGEGILSNPYKI